MSFPNETPLEDLLKYIKQATTGPNYSGIPRYVDPTGLQEAGKDVDFDNPARPRRHPAPADRFSLRIKHSSWVISSTTGSW